MPRTVEAKLSVNTELFDRFVRRSHRVERAKVGLRRNASRLLRDGAFRRVGRRIESGLGRIRDRRDVGRIGRTKTFLAMERATYGFLRDGYRAMVDDLAASLRELAIQEARFTVKALGEAIEFDFTARVPAIGKFRDLIQRQPIAGNTLGQWARGMATRTTADTMRQLRLGLGSRETTDKILRRVTGRKGVLDKALRNVETLADSAGTHAMDGGRSLADDENAEVIGWEVWTAILDGHACPICISLDGKRFRVGEGPHPITSTHPGCRCNRIPQLKSAKELGLKASELEPIQRRALDGKVTPRTTGVQWLKRQSAKVQDDMLGPTRGRLFRRGEVTIDRMIDEHLQPLTLDELGRQEGIEIKRVRRAPKPIPIAELRRKPEQMTHLGVPRTKRRVELSGRQRQAQQNAAWLRANDAARKAATFSERRDWMQWEWVHGSNRRTSVLMKEAAIKEFRLSGIPFSRGKSYKIRGPEIALARRDLRRMQRETLAYFRRRGIKTIKLYRGRKGRVTNPSSLTSWTTDRRIAERFDGHEVLEMEIPVERILTGRGVRGWTDGIWGDQGEWVVMT